METNPDRPREPKRARHQQAPGNRRSQDRYGLVLIATLVTLIVIAALGDLRGGRALGPILLGGVFALTLLTSSAGKKSAMLASGGVVVAIVAAVMSAALGAALVARVIALLISAAFVVGSPVVIVRRLISHRDVSVRTVLGALCLYLFLALFFAFVYMLFDAFSDASFFAQVAKARTVDFIYFSLVTITTVGYGDLTPVSDLGHMTAVIEAIVGQFYLVTVIALLVSNLVVVRKDRRQDADSEE
jgi:hypothetical protein